MAKIVGKVVSVHVGTREDMSKQPLSNVKVELDGFVGDNHQGFMREAYAGDKDPEGTIRRNERQWSAICAEELQAVSQELNLNDTIRAEDVGANLCLTGIPDLSTLPSGARLCFSSGAILVVEEYNPPCMDMGEKLSKLYQKTSGEPLTARDFVLTARKRRGLVGVVDVAGDIRAEDEVTLELPR